MSENYSVGRVYPSDKRQIEKIKALLSGEGIRLDPHLDYLCALEDDEGELAGCAGSFGNTLRCFAVKKELQGRGLMGLLISHLIERQNERGVTDLFVFTKCSAAGFFKDCGFYELARIEGRLSLLENRRDGLSRWIENAKAQLPEGEKTAVVMNANPFTNGHHWLLEQAAAQGRPVAVFLLSEDQGPIPFKVRFKLAKEGAADIPGVTVIPSGPYMISSATFPSYFQKDEDDVVWGQALLDAELFGKIAKALDIKTRFVGQEPFSKTTALYNEVLKESLPEKGVEIVEIPRLGSPEAISASTVRELIKEGGFEALSELVPETTLDFFKSPEAQPIINAIKALEDVRHH
ncbi:MAG: GNAT family N-acetyltransferase [Firmicutes bacterium]|nr:GNAT family N-acetyltransferase [Bacillota bacterium]